MACRLVGVHSRARLSFSDVSKYIILSDHYRLPAYMRRGRWDA